MEIEISEETFQKSSCFSFNAVYYYIFGQSVQKKVNIGSEAIENQGKMNESCRLCRKDCHDVEDNMWSYYEGVRVSELCIRICGIQVSESPSMYSSDQSLYPMKVCEECLEV
jgi:hypothetical protein